MDIEAKAVEVVRNIYSGWCPPEHVAAVLSALRDAYDAGYEDGRFDPAAVAKATS